MPSLPNSSKFNSSSNRSKAATQPFSNCNSKWGRHNRRPARRKQQRSRPWEAKKEGALTTEEFRCPAA